MKDFNSEDSQEIKKKFKSIISSRLDKLFNEFDGGVGGELYAYSIAVNNQRREQEKKSTIKTPMNQEIRLKEMIQAALSKPSVDEDETAKKGIIDEPISEDLDLGHQDNEPHMLKADLYRIGKYAMELYKMIDQYEGEQEVDFPHWWQAKIINAKSCLVAAKHYLDFELKEPQIDDIVGVASEEGDINERDLPAGEEKIVKGIKKSGDFKKNDPSLYAIARSIYNKKHKD